MTAEFITVATLRLTRRAMRHGLVSMLVPVLAACAAQNTPVGPWSRLTDEMQEKDEFRSERPESCIPSVSEIEEPIFPGAEVAYVFSSRKAPHCDRALDMRKSELELIMMTTVQMDEVVQWYAARLPGYKRYGYPGGKGVIFVNGGPNDFSWERDKERVPYLYIDEPMGVWAQLGYRTTIDFIRPKR